MYNTQQRGMRNWGVKIIGTGRHLPGESVSNQELIDRLGLRTSDEWIRNNLGIRSRHFAPPGIATSDIAACAAQEALQDAGIDARDLDRIILCTSSPDWLSPAASSNVQRLLGANCPVEDKLAACAGFVFGLDHAARLIATGLKRVLVIGADVKSRFVRQDDFRLLPIFADGAGAVILAPHDGDGGLLECELWSDGTRAQNLITPAGGSAMPATHETVEQGLHAVTMQAEGKVIYQDAVDCMTALSRQVCAQRGVAPRDVDLFIPHQANVGIMRDVARNLEIPEERIVITIDHAANIVAGTIPFALDFALRAGRGFPGSLILMATAGAGYAGGAVLYAIPS